MKGLLLKDWYMMKKYCKMYFFLSVVFIAGSLVNDTLYFAVYPGVFCSMIPMTLFAYDEHSRWVQYSGTMPYTKAQIVSGKYIIGLLTQLAALVLMGIAQAVKMMIGGDFIPGDFAASLSLVLVVSTLSPAISLPFVFKLGIEKGRIASSVMAGFVCAAGALSAVFLGSGLGTEIKSGPVPAILAVAGIGIYLLSWHMSVTIYKKREIQ